MMQLTKLVCVNTHIHTYTLHCRKTERERKEIIGTENGTKETTYTHNKLATISDEELSYKKNKYCFLFLVRPHNNLLTGTTKKPKVQKPPHTQRISDMRNIKGGFSLNCKDICRINY